MKPCLSSPLVLTGPPFYPSCRTIDLRSWLCGPIQLLRDGGPILRDELEAQGAKQASVLNGQQRALRPIIVHTLRLSITLH
jgi:hypothetical protein